MAGRSATSRLTDEPWRALASRLAILVDLTDDEREVLRTASIHAKMFESGENIFNEGGDQSSIYLCIHGWGARYRLLPDGQRQVLDLVLPGNIFGGTNSDHGHHVSSAEALLDLHVAILSTDSMRHISQNSPRLACALVLAMGEEWARLSERVVSLGRRDAFERLAHFFLEIQHRLMHTHETHGSTVRVPIPQQEMADFMGLTSVHVSRTMRKMMDMGLINYDDEFVEILNAEALAESCDFDPERMNASTIPDAIRLAILNTD